MHKIKWEIKGFVESNSLFKEKSGLVRFVDNCPWTSSVHGQLSMFHGHCPWNIYIVHILWTMSMLHGQCPWNIRVNIFRKNCPPNIVIVHISWTIYMKYKHIKTNNITLKINYYILLIFEFILFPRNFTHSFKLNFSRVPNGLNSICMSLGHRINK